MRRALAIGMAAAVLATAACSQAQSANGGPTVSRNFPVGGFSAIEVAGPYAIQVQTSGNPSVSASGPQKMIDNMVVEVNGDRLLIHPRAQNGSFHFGWHMNDTVHVTVSVPQLAAAVITGSGDIRVNEVKGNSFDGHVGGSGDLAVDHLDVQSLKLAIDGSGDIKAANGRAQSATYSNAGSGDIDAKGVQTQTASVTVAGSGDISAHAKGTADVSMQGSGDVELSGGGKCTISKQGSGDVRCS
jgi:hypothetical protein